MNRIYLFVISMIIYIMHAFPLYSYDADTSVVKVIVTSQNYNQDSPWQKGDVTSYYVMGTVISGNRILTTAYSLANHVLIEVVKHGGTRKYEAEIIIKDYFCDLALLRVKDKEFFKDLTPVPLSEDVSVIGGKGIIRKWDSSGASKEYITETVKSSIMIYRPHCAVLMHIMSTNMNDGGYGEPVFIDGKLVGIVSELNTKTKIINVISAKTVKRMVNDLDDGKYEGVPFFWIEYTTIDSDMNFREYLGMKENEEGIFVSGISNESSGSDVLKEGDVILSLNRKNIGDDGMYKSEKFGKLNFYGIIYIDNYVGNTVEAEIIRDKKRKKVKFPLRPLNNNSFIIPQISFDRQPKYFIYGGLIFQELTRGYLTAWGNEWELKADNRLLFYYYKNLKVADKNKKRFVLLNKVLPAACNNGYQNKQNLILKSVNGKKVKNIFHLKELLTKIKDRYIKFDFIGGKSIVLKSDEVKKNQGDILKTYRIDKPDFTER